MQGLWPAFPLIEMRVTYIQPVFDRRVQHGEVCEEDTQVGHGALGIGLCKKQKEKVFHLFPRGYYSHGEKSPHREGFQSSRLQLFFKRWLMIQHITHATAPLFHFAVARWSIPLQSSIKPLKHPRLALMFCRITFSSALCLKSIIKLKLIVTESF